MGECHVSSQAVPDNNDVGAARDARLEPRCKPSHDVAGTGAGGLAGGVTQDGYASRGFECEGECVGRVVGGGAGCVGDDEDGGCGVCAAEFGEFFLWAGG